MSKDKIAEIQLVRDGVQPVLKVTVPKGTKLSDTLKLQPQALGHPRQAQGLPAVQFRRSDLVPRARGHREPGKIDLGTMKRI